jgi:hypothetical protein
MLQKAIVRSALSRTHTKPRRTCRTTLALVKRLFIFLRLSSNIWISQTLYVWLVFTTQLGLL